MRELDKTNRRTYLMEFIRDRRQFTERELIDKLLEISNDELLVDNSTTIKEYLFSLCNRGTLRYDGFKFSVVPTDKRLGYRLASLRVLGEL